MNHNLNYITAEEAAEMVRHGDTIGFSGFTPAGAAKAIPKAIADKARREHAAGRDFKIGVVTGASTGEMLDGELARAKAISWRTPYQSNRDLRDSINKGETRFFDMHLSQVPQAIRYGFLGNFDFAIVEASSVTPDGEIVPTTSVGASPTFCRVAKKIIVEVNRFHPAALKGFHDIFELKNPPHRRPIPLEKCDDRIGRPMVKVNPAKIVGVVETNIPDETASFRPMDPVTARIGKNVAEFIASEVREGRIPPEFLPVQSGVGNIANAVLGAMGEHPDIPTFQMFTEVIQDSVITLMDHGKVSFATGTSLTVSQPVLKKIYDNLEFYRWKMLLRPQEITNNPEMVRRLGIISVNTALEVDVFGNVNSTHVLGRSLMNGIGGSADFTRNGYISIFTCPSTAKGGKISSIVPMVAHMDHSEHSVQVIATERGVADLRGKNPHERAKEIVMNCAHPDYQDELFEYFVEA
ncbi:MAG: succinate CoA transferase, partial [Verrucomicrobiae bacterium]|nr:succinate CoA transferase [Verrucomicrobiae bacterium]